MYVALPMSYCYSISSLFNLMLILKYTFPILVQGAFIVHYK